MAWQFQQVDWRSCTSCGNRRTFLYQRRRLMPGGGGWENVPEIALCHECFQQRVTQILNRTSEDLPGNGNSIEDADTSEDAA